MNLKQIVILTIGIGGIFLFSGCGGPKAPSVPVLDNSTLPDSKLKCARIKGGLVIQTYNGVLKNSQVWINNKNFTKRYKITDISYEEIAKSGQKGHFCNLIDANSYKKPSNASNLKLKCARMKNGMVLQTYDGVLKSDQIWIGSKNFTNRYTLTKTPYEELAKSGQKGHFCNIVK